ncbi:acyl-CoA dehydrogenase family protein [Halocatena marina]|uniref:acyl-CoA dehydrogenase family protein n=1 Tax=Halocatena marina TaxID=2934937 RepID=UPI0022241FB4|nr:acyl-CoA dehydrogenase family protein [Halocatena marina]
MTSDPIDYSDWEAGRDCNYWTLDRTLQAAAQRAYSEEDFEWAEPRLRELGSVTGNTIVDHSDTIDRHGPELHSYDRWGEIQNEVEYHPKQYENERITYSEFGLSHDVFHAPADREEPLGFAHALTMETILSFVDPGFVCPVAMTVGAAIVLDKYGKTERQQEYFRRLTTRDPDEYIEGAMFLTEKQGGSDVGANETIATETDKEGVYHLTGEKWFCSNIDAEGTLALARREGAPDGTKGLSLFVLPHTKENGERNDQLYRRLKDKLGTISVPTGEVELNGAEAYLVGEPENGFNYMTEMLNFERLSNAAASIGIMGRCLLESKIQAANREAFDRTIDQFPLMRRDLIEMAVDYEAATAFVFETARLLDKAEKRDDDDARRLLRLFVPIAKYRTAREAVDTASYACEILGGNGYVRGFATARLLRDAQVLPIWEGTSNILSLDVLRVLERENAHEMLIEAITERLDSIDHSALTESASTVETEFTDLQKALLTLAREDREYAQLQAKELVDYIYDVFVAAELLTVAQDELRDGNGRMALVAQLFIDRLDNNEARGITSGSRRKTEAFDTIVRYADVASEQLK